MGTALTQSTIDAAWRPANGGTEEAYTTRTGHLVQYLYNTVTGRHAFYCLSDDTFIGDTVEAQTNYGILF